MVFAPDTEVVLRFVVNLINTAANGEENLATTEDLDRLPAAERVQRFPNPGRGRAGQRPRGCAASSPRCGRRTRTPPWQSVNRLLREAHALPQLVKHDQWDWHLHATTHDAPLADRMGTEAAMALVDVIRSKEMDRLLVCAADDCDAVVLDLSRNRSKRYCDTGNCANRAHVAAYRARRASGE